MIRETFEDILEKASSLLAGHGTLEELQQANDCINLALQLRANDGSAWILKGYIMSCLGDDSAALASAEMAGRDLPDDPEVYYVKATALGDMALFDEEHGKAEGRVVDSTQEFLLCEEVYVRRAIKASRGQS